MIEAAKTFAFNFTQEQIDRLLCLIWNQNAQGNWCNDFNIPNTTAAFEDIKAQCLINGATLGVVSLSFESNPMRLLVQVDGAYDA